MKEKPHDVAVTRLKRRVQKRFPYAKIFEKYTYKNPCFNDESGECDLLALLGFYTGKRKYALIFEVKSARGTKNRGKVLSQLEKDVREVSSFFGEDVRTFRFHVYTSKNYFRNTRWAQKPYSITWVRG